MREYVDFLGGQSPYDALDSADLEALSRLVEVEYFTAGSTIVAAGDAPLSHFYVVRTGEVEVIDRGRVVDALGPGETFGQISVLSGLAPPLTVKAVEDTLCYRFPDPRPHLRDPGRLQFSHYGSLVTRERLARSGLVDQALRLVRHQMRPIVWCDSAATVAEAAAAMTDAGQSCALIPRGEHVGIITDSDFRTALAAGTLTASTPAGALASFPAETVGAESLVGDAFLKMVESGYHHLVVTGAAERPVGILRVVDLASAEVRNPLVIRRAIDDATSVDDLAAAAALVPGTWLELYDTGASVMHIAALMSAVIDAIMLRLIDLTEIGEDRVPQRTSWLLLGSIARREPLPRSDVDTALVWEDLPDGPPAAGRLQRWAGRVLDNMERCGLSRCVDGANATNPSFAQSQSAFTATATSWITNPTQTNALLLSSMIADSRPVTGVPLGRAVSDAMLATTRSREYLSRLLSYTISVRPPVGFVRDFVVEHSGAHRGHLNLKGGGLVPIASLGRWIAIVTGDDRGSTITRLRRGQAAGLLTTDEADTLVRAFEYLYGLLLDNEIRALRTNAPASSTWIAPKELGTLTRRYLREAFRAVAEVQNRLDSEWVERLS
ncbi:CBS domain-containing protein [Mycolicibacterium moriokaense]|nr:CBS domain-containing protein [Mycolicibacterium moriokaense]